MTAEEIQLEHATQLLEEWSTRAKAAQDATARALIILQIACPCVRCANDTIDQLRACLEEIQRALTEDKEDA